MTRIFRTPALVLAATFALPFGFARAANPPVSETSPSDSTNEDLLTQPKSEESLTGEKSGAPLKERSFGEELMRLGINVSWSGLGGVIFDYEPGGTTTFNDAMFHTILSAKMGDNLVSEVEFEIDPRGVMAHYLVLDYTISSALTIRVGKFLTPVGRFNEVLHPVFRWETVTYPLMFTEVIPAIWSEHGLQLRGNIPLGFASSADYALFVANGMALPNNSTTASTMPGMGTGMAGMGLAGMMVGPTGFLGTLQDNVIDNNKDKAVGGRIGATLFNDSTFGATKLGISGYTSAIDPAGRVRLSILDADFSIRLADLSLRAEAAQTYLGNDQNIFQAFERGIYMQGTYRLDRFQFTARWDWAATWNPSALDAMGNVMMPTGTMPGMPMGSMDMPAMIIQRQIVFCIGYAPSPLWSLRAEVRTPLGMSDPSTGATMSGAGTMTTLRSPKAAAMVSFYF